MSTTYPGRSRYTESAAARYQQRKPSKHNAELALVARALADVPRGSALDVPCGGGRISLLMARLGYKVTSADLSPAMVKIAKETVCAASLDIPVHQRDIESLDYESQSFDSAICFRLFHHFPTPEIRSRAVAELCRVARHHVLISYFSPTSFTAVKRKFQTWCFGKQRMKFHTPLSEVAEYFAPHGFKLIRDHARQRYVHTLHLALFDRHE